MLNLFDAYKSGLDKKQSDIEHSLRTILKQNNFPVVDIDSNRRYWFIRTSAGTYFNEFYKDGFVGIGHEDVPCVSVKDRTPELIEQIKKTHKQSTRILNQVYTFCKELKKGDIVIIPSYSSAMFSFGIIEDDDIFVKDVDSDNTKGKCPYKRRRKTTWIRNIPKGRVDSKLYAIFRNQQTLSNVDDYQDFIERAITPFYVKNNVAHLTLTLQPILSPNALDIPLYIQGLLIRAQEIQEKYNLPSNEHVRSRTNVQCAGLIELFGEPLAIFAIAIILVALVGGKASGIKKQNGDIEGSIESQGLVPEIMNFVLALLDRYHDDKMIGTKQMEEAQKRLEICDPRQSNTPKQKKKHRRNKKRK